MKSDKKNQPRSWHERDLDRVMLGAVVLNALGTLILGVGHELGLYASTGTIAALLIAGLGIKLGRATVTSRLALALALSLPVMAQMHLPPTSLGLFNAFVTLSLMQAYRDWRPIALLAAVLGLHHVLTAEWLALGLVALQSAVLSGLAIIQQREISTARELEFLVNAMGREGKIRLNFDVVRMQTPTGQRLQHVQQRMASVVGQLHQLSQLMAHTAQQMALDSTDLTGRTETTANGLRDAAMCLNQISIIVESSINASSEALQFARDAADTAKQGNHVVEEVIGTMHNIEASSKRVTDIIAVIDGIAFQTNILSLNAAVEAARAGEQGRGFAVVASEVRNLALRSAEAAKEIRQLIHTSVATVATGTQQVSSAGQTMNQLVEAVDKVGKLFQSSAADTAEYVQGMQTVTASVENLSELTEKNLAISEHARTSASDLLAHMGSLTEALSAFNLGHLAPLEMPARQEPDVPPTRPSPAESRPQTPHHSAPAPAPSAAQSTNTVDFF